MERAGPEEDVRVGATAATATRAGGAVHVDGALLTTAEQAVSTPLRARAVLVGFTPTVDVTEVVASAQREVHEGDGEDAHHQRGQPSRRNVSRAMSTTISPSSASRPTAFT